jgi:hypothetical protein
MTAAGLLLVILSFLLNELTNLSSKYSFAGEFRFWRLSRDCKGAVRPRTAIESGRLFHIAVKELT